MGGTFFLNFTNIGKLDGRGFDINAKLFALQNVTVEMLPWKCSQDVLEFDVLPLFIIIIIIIIY